MTELPRQAEIWRNEMVDGLIRAFIRYLPIWILAAALVLA